MSFVDDNPNYEIVTEEQARNWIVERIDLVTKVRHGVNFVFPGDRQKTVEFQRSAYRKFLGHHGGVLGMLAVLYWCQRLGKEAHERLRSEAMSLLGPSLITGRYDWFASMESEPRTEREARTWMQEQIEALELIRLDCNVHYPGDAARTKIVQETADLRFVVKHGGVMGMLVALHRCRLLEDVAYNEFRAAAMATMVPTIVGEQHVGLR